MSRSAVALTPEQSPPHSRFTFVRKALRTLAPVAFSKSAKGWSDRALAQNSTPGAVHSWSGGSRTSSRADYRHSRKRSTSRFQGRWDILTVFQNHVKAPRAHFHPLTRVEEKNKKQRRERIARDNNGGACRSQGACGKIQGRKQPGWESDLLLNRNTKSLTRRKRVKSALLPWNCSGMWSRRRSAESARNPKRGPGRHCGEWSKLGPGYPVRTTSSLTVHSRINEVRDHP